MGNAASSLPYSIGKTPLVTNVNQEGWNFHDGQRKSDNTSVSVFVAKKPSLQKTLLGSGGGGGGGGGMTNTTNRNQMTQYACAMHHFMYAKKLRHPNILSVTATLDTDNPNDSTSGGGGGGGGGNQQQQTSMSNGISNTTTTASSSSSSSSKDAGDLIIVTEPCIPFAVWIRQHQHQQQQPITIDQLIWGLHCIITAVSFLHQSAQVVHGNITLDSLYVTPAGDVKLWNFSLVSSFTTTNTSSQSPSVPRHFIDHEAAITPLLYRSPERIEQRYDVIAASGVHVMDSYSMGILITRLFGALQYPVPNVLLKAVQRLQTSNLKMRPKLAPLLKCPIFDTFYTQFQLSLLEFPVMTMEQKIRFWNDTVTIAALQQSSSSSLPSTSNTNTNTNTNSNTVPLSVIIQKIVPMIKNEITSICDNETLRSQEVYRKEVLVMLNPLFYIAENILDRETLVTQQIGKIIGILYKVNDRAIRGTLLQKANYMADHFDKTTLNDAVFEPMCGGFSDSSSALRELTLKATASLVPHLSHPNLEKLSRYLVRLQSDPESSIRTNTVIFFSKLAPYLTEVTRQKILLPAFVRAMKDPFTPCRLAALRSTVKAKTFFDPMGIASRVMPAITPQLLDPSGEVRREAFTAVDDLLFVLRQESERLSTLPEQTIMNPNIPTSSSSVPGVSTTATNGGVPPGAPSSGVSTGRPNVTSTIAPASGVPTPPSSSGFSLGGISSWMTTSSKPTTTTTKTVTPPAPSAVPIQQQQQPVYPTQQQSQQNVASSSAYAAPTVAMNQMNLNSNTTSGSTSNYNDDNWDDVDDNDDDDDDGGWGDDDDVLDVSIPKSSSIRPQQTQSTMMKGVGSSTSASSTMASTSLFSTTNNDEDDFFGGFDSKPAKPVVRSMNTGTTAGMGKLTVPVKKSLGGGKLSTTPKPVIKKLLTNTSKSDEDGTDNWDDF